MVTKRTLSLMLVGLLTVLCVWQNCIPASAASATNNTAYSGAKLSTWDDDNSLKILAIGNSYSECSMQYVYPIAEAMGVENIKVVNMYIAGCTLQTHLQNARNDSAAYEYCTNVNGNWSREKSHKLSDAIKSDDWDFISFQQSSTYSGRSNTYDDLKALMDIVEPMCTNDNVEFVWHMTWAYQADYSGLAAYNNSQTDMYNAIVSAVQDKIVPNDRITKIIPNGTVIQNARTSYLGDKLTNDGTHLSMKEPRFLASLATVATLLEVDLNSIDLSSLGYSSQFVDTAIRSVKYALAKPFEVTTVTAHTCVYDQQVVSAEFLKSPADCTNAAEYYKSCSCGESSKGTTLEATFTSGDPKGHTEGTEWKTDKENHWKACECGEKIKLEAHKDSDHNSKCDICAYNTGAAASATKSPNTGDGLMFNIWLVALVISGLSISSVKYFRKIK